MTAASETSSPLLQITDTTSPVDATAKEAAPGRGVTKFGTMCAFLKNGTCSRTLMTVINQDNERPLRLEEKATDPLAGGMMHGYQCGMLWGATLAAGAQAYALHGSGPRAESAAMLAAKRLTDSFRDLHGSIDCVDITDTNPQDTWKVFVNFFVKGGTISCARRIAGFAPTAAQEIEAALSEGRADAACDSANCAAMLAREAGASEMHAVMAAGFAGGIGLSGGGCGALGAAIWLLAMNGDQHGLSNKTINKRISEITESFLKASGYEFECSEIVGRKFEDMDDHSNHVREGGCSNIIEALASSVQLQSASDDS